MGRGHSMLGPGWRCEVMSVFFPLGRVLLNVAHGFMRIA